MRDFIKKIVYEKTHIDLSELQLTRIIEYVEHSDISMSDFRQLDANSIPSWLVEHITIHETFFFRQANYLDHVVSFAKRESRASLKILSVGCSTGEEVYSLAMILKENNIFSSIEGIDISSRAIEKAKSACYDRLDYSRVPPAYLNTLKNYSSIIEENESFRFEVNESIRRLVEFRCANIFDENIANYDVILCRNILIYFSTHNRVELLSKLVASLADPGLICLGSCELWPGKTALKRLAPGIYEKGLTI